MMEMLVEQVNRFLNSSFTIFFSKCGTNKVSEEGIRMSLYAWNSAHVLGTDICYSDDDVTSYNLCRTNDTISIE